MRVSRCHDPGAGEPWILILKEVQTKAARDIGAGNYLGAGRQGKTNDGRREKGISQVHLSSPG